MLNAKLETYFLLAFLSGCVISAAVFVKTPYLRPVEVPFYEPEGPMEDRAADLEAKLYLAKSVLANTPFARSVQRELEEYNRERRTTTPIKYGSGISAFVMLVLGIWMYERRSGKVGSS